jgi:hypothetical protein
MVASQGHTPILVRLFIPRSSVLVLVLDDSSLSDLERPTLLFNMLSVDDKGIRHSVFSYWTWFSVNPLASTSPSVLGRPTLLFKPPLIGDEGISIFARSRLLWQHTVYQIKTSRRRRLGSRNIISTRDVRTTLHVYHVHNARTRESVTKSGTQSVVDYTADVDSDGAIVVNVRMSSYFGGHQSHHGPNSNGNGIISP